MNKTNESEQKSYESELVQIITELTPRVSTEKSGLTPEQYAAFIAQRPYELSSSPDYTAWADDF